MTDRLREEEEIDGDGEISSNTLYKSYEEE
jgi:hypothetical protein